MHSVIRWCLDNPAIVVLANVLLVVAGVAGLLHINQELLPSVDIPSASVLVAEPGASSEQVDRDLAQPLASALSGRPGETHVATTSTLGFVEVDVVFGLDTSASADLDAVKQRLGQVTLPAAAGAPVVESFNPSTQTPAMVYSLAVTDGDLSRATREARDVVAPALRGASGVAEVRVVGGSRPAVTVTVNAARLAADHVSVAQVRQALAGAQVDVPAGTSVQSDQSTPVEVVGTLRTADDLRSLVVSAAPPSPPAALPVVLGDVATVADDQELVGGITRRDGLPALLIEVFRAPGGGTIGLSHDVRQRAGRLRLDPHDDVQLLSDAAVDIQASLNDLVLKAVLGAVLAVLVVFLFLRSVTATLVTAIALPTSAVAALLGTSVAGFSLNVLTLAGLTVAVGRIVDDAIVVLENSYRHLQLGRPPLEAAYLGATEVSTAVISSTLTTVSVFLPIGLVGGLVSKFFLPFSLTVTLSLLASLVVALTLIPVMASFLLRRPRAAGAPGRPPGEPAGALARAYRPVIAWSLARGWRKAAILVGALVLLAGSLATLVVVPKNLLDLGTSNEIDGSVGLPPGTSAEQTSEKLQAFETAALADPAVRNTQVTIATGERGGQRVAPATNRANVTVWVRNPADAAAVARRLQDRLDQLYGRGSGQLGLALVGPATSRLFVNLQGEDETALRQASDQVVGALSSDPELTNVRSDLAAATPELQVSVDPSRAAARGLSSREVAALVSGVLGATDVSTLGPAGPTIRLRFDPGAVAPDRLAGLPVAPGTVLGDVASVGSTLAPTAIIRSDGVENVGIGADIVSTDTRGATARAHQRLAGLRLPDGVTLGGGGGGGLDISTAFDQMIVAIEIAVGVVALVLVAFFRSLVTPFVVLLTMPLALIGSFPALLLAGQPLGLPALLGVLMLLGIAVSNAILLIDFVERDRRDRPLVEALVHAGGVRVRPILMTAVVTIVALVPVSSGTSAAGAGSLVTRSLALVVQGGLVSSTILTLVVVPIAYSLLRRGARRPRRERTPDAA